MSTAFAPSGGSPLVDGVDVQLQELSSELRRQLGELLGVAFGGVEVNLEHGLLIHSARILRRRAVVSYP